jgi:hypothetical protein
MKIENARNKTGRKNEDVRREEWRKIEEIEINSCR